MPIFACASGQRKMVENWFLMRITESHIFIFKRYVFTRRFLCSIAIHDRGSDNKISQILCRLAALPDEIRYGAPRFPDVQYKTKADGRNENNATDIEAALLV